eukprot:GSA25T00014528001.1
MGLPGERGAGSGVRLSGNRLGLGVGYSQPPLGVLAGFASEVLLRLVWSRRLVPPRPPRLVFVVGVRICGNSRPSGEVSCSGGAFRVVWCCPWGVGSLDHCKKVRGSWWALWWMWCASLHEFPAAWPRVVFLLVSCARVCRRSSACAAQSGAAVVRSCGRCLVWWLPAGFLPHWSRRRVACLVLYKKKPGPFRF